MKIVVNADDFGRSHEINQAIALAHREGILTSASLMVAGEAAEEAVGLAREMPGLAVGLHVVVVDGPAVLPARQIPHLVDERGWFASAPGRLGLRYYFSRRAREELRQELEAQFERFAATGLALSHVDGHLHMHVHPTVFDMVVPLAERYGAKGIRLPRDAFVRAMQWRVGGCIGKGMQVGVLGILSGWCARRLRGRGLVSLPRTYGLAQSGQMTEESVMRLLRQMDEPAAEIYFHPTTGPRLDALGPNPEDLKALLSDEVRRVIEDRGLELCTYARVRGMEAGSWLR